MNADQASSPCRSAVGLGFLVALARAHGLPVVGQPRQIQFFFSTPLDVLARVVTRVLATGEIWRHLGSPWSRRCSPS